MLGSSLMSSGIDWASLPDGLTWPKITSASAGPPDWPSNQDSRMPLAFLAHGATVITEPLDSTTTTFWFAAATCSSRVICLAGMSRASRSKPSDSAASGRPRNMRTTSAFLAVSTASDSRAGSAGSRSSVKPGAKSALMPRSASVSRKLVILVGVMWEEPPPW